MHRNQSESCNTVTLHRVRRRGGAAVELAIILPMCMTLALGCVDFARVIHAQIALANSARVGADYGATHGMSDDTRSDWEAVLSQIVREEACSIPSFDSSRLHIAVDATSEDDNRHTVTVTCRYVFQTAVAWPALPSTISLRHSVAMRQYQ